MADVRDRQTSSAHGQRSSTHRCEYEADKGRVALWLDPDDLDCSQLFLPKAFTPNDDGRNDEFGISNPYAVDELVSFEIFDRWGSRIFVTADPMEKWNGTYKGKELNPGVFLYKVRFRCNGEEFADVGSLSLIK